MVSVGFNLVSVCFRWHRLVKLGSVGFGCFWMFLVGSVWFGWFRQVSVGLVGFGLVRFVFVNLVGSRDKGCAFLLVWSFFWKRWWSRVGAVAFSF